MKNKKKAIIYGNCHTGVIKAYLEQCSQLMEEYYFYDIPEIQNIKKPDFFTQTLFEDCKLFIHQSIRAENRYGPEYASDNIIKFLKPDCKIISIPNVYHLPMCFFPQYYEAKELRYNNKTFFFRDRIIDEGIKRGKSFSSIKRDYMSSTYFEWQEIKTMYDLFIAKVRKREEDWDVKVVEYIENESRNKQLFYDPNHPCNNFLMYVSKEIIKILYPHDIISLVQTSGTEIPALDTYEMPLCYAVTTFFGINHKFTYREYGRKVLHKNMDLENYIKQYFSMCWIANDFSLYIRMRSIIMWVCMKVLDIPYLVRKIGKKIISIWTLYFKKKN